MKNKDNQKDSFQKQTQTGDTTRCGDKSKSKLYKLFEEKEQSNFEYFQKNQIDAPNEIMQYAIIEGIGFNKDEILCQNEFLSFFNIGLEKFYCWTPSDAEFSLLVAKVDPIIKKEKLWKTSTSIFEIAFALSSSLEMILEFDYDWIYNFDSSKKINNQKYLKKREETLGYKNIYTHHKFGELASLIDLLNRDDKFFIACQNIIAAMQNHAFCQICALTPEHLKEHSNQEPNIWERVSLIPKMESAIVQATRCVEAILGKPGDRKIPLKLERVKERWRRNVLIDPDEEFKLGEKSFLEFYYDLFTLRGYASHSLGNLSYQMQRCQTIEAQSFAWVLIKDYYKKLRMKNEKALITLNFNYDLLN
ncbi:MAG: hypothetical protein KTR26_04910 [Flammeovirgaceae bacterium]|nr:hypothetical protein [Flammeovirgaceae bacterium]